MDIKWSLKYEGRTYAEKHKQASVTAINLKSFLKTAFRGITKIVHNSVSRTLDWPYFCQNSTLDGTEVYCWRTSQSLLELKKSRSLQKCHIHGNTPLYVSDKDQPTEILRKYSTPPSQGVAAFCF